MEFQKCGCQSCFGFDFVGVAGEKPGTVDGDMHCWKKRKKMVQQMARV